VDRIKVGIYFLGTRKVTLYLNPKIGGGSFLTSAPPHELAEIVVGSNGNAWSMVVAILLHESLEFQFLETGNRYTPNPDYAVASDGYVFFMDHNGFSQAVARTADFLATALPDLRRVYTKASRPRKRPKKRPKRVRKGRKK
jgi:hypothetical protein